MFSKVGFPQRLCLLSKSTRIPDYEPFAGEFRSRGFYYFKCFIVHLITLQHCRYQTLFQPDLQRFTKVERPSVIGMGL